MVYVLQVIFVYVGVCLYMYACIYVFAWTVFSATGALEAGYKIKVPYMLNIMRLPIHLWQNEEDCSL